MVKKRASLKDKGEELLGIKRGGKGADILFGAEAEAEPEVEGTLSMKKNILGIFFYD